jgi:hypothetical protein
MVVRIRFGKSSRLVPHRRKNRRVALAFGALLTPVALAAASLGFWCVAADLDWAASFVFTTGILAHWHVWMVAAGAVQLCAHTLNRYGKGADPAPEAPPVSAAPARTPAAPPAAVPAPRPLPRFRTRGDAAGF